jgi:hypothetical protein
LSDNLDDFANAFQTPNRQLGTNDCILGRASRKYDGGRVKIGDNLPHLPVLRNFFPYVSSVNEWQAAIVSRTMTVGMVLTTRYVSSSSYDRFVEETTYVCVKDAPGWS